ncbi:hypothetical protein PIB30_104303, partial [Stylosanthes scabra]|nr:hypothetical protein [Stylosanthes scabra]
MGARRTTEEKLEEKMHETRNEIIEMRNQIRDWTRNASSREANPNLVEIPPHKIPDFLHSNVANKKDLTLELSNQIYNKENPPMLLTKLPKILLILRIK